VGQADVLGTPPWLLRVYIHAWCHRNEYPNPIADPINYLAPGETVEEWHAANDTQQFRWRRRDSDEKAR
jgi:hypothetical protein